MSNTPALELALNQALGEWSIVRARMGLVTPGHALDSKRTEAWCEYGFPASLEFKDFYNLYRRGGIAAGAVNKILSRCWVTRPWIIQGDPDEESKNETAWEKKLKPLMRRGKFWREFKEADRRRLVSRYSGLLLHIGDNGRWDQPVRRSAALKKMTPAWECSLKPKGYDANGDVSMWQYSTTQLDNATATTFDIHPDRVFILGDWSSEGIGFLEPAYNNFVSIEKIEGGSGESYLKNASRHLNINFDKDVRLNQIAEAHGVPVGELQRVFDDVTREVNRGNDTTVVTQGATVTPLVANVPDPTGPYNINLQTAASGLDIPTKILVGQQTGERASTEDEKYMNKRCQSRREDLGDEIGDLLEQLMRIKVVDFQEEFTVMWDDLTESSLADKLANADKMSAINERGSSSGRPYFQDNEIRTTAGFQPDPELDLPPLPDDEDV